MTNLITFAFALFYITALIFFLLHYDAETDYHREEALIYKAVGITFSVLTVISMLLLMAIDLGV